jgi:hypothetical protein
MTIVHGRVVNGHIEVDGFVLRDGLEVEVSIPAADGEYDLTEEQEAETANTTSPRSRKPRSKRRSRRSSAANMSMATTSFAN